MTNEELLRKKLADYTPEPRALSEPDFNYKSDVSIMTETIATTPPATSGFWESLGNALGNSAGTLAGQVINNGTAAASGAINTALPPPAPAPVAAKPFFSTPAGMILGGAAVIGGIIYLARK